MTFLRPKTDAGPAGSAVATPAATARPVDAGGESATSTFGKAVEAANEAAGAETARADAESAAGDDATDSAAKPTGSGAAGAARGAAASAPAAPVLAADTAGLPRDLRVALAERKVVVLLFWSPRASDDRDVHRALRAVDTHDGRVFVQAADVRAVAAYGAIARGAGVSQSPTVVVVGRDRKVQTLVGFGDTTSIDQLVTDALRSS
jgi:hypothetical protein